MPYLPSDAEKKSQLYSNMINGDTREYQEEINDLKNKQQVSASICSKSKNDFKPISKNTPVSEYI